MSGNLRVLTPEELPLIAGGSMTGAGDVNYIPPTSDYYFSNIPVFGATSWTTSSFGSNYAVYSAAALAGGFASTNDYLQHNAFYGGGNAAGESGMIIMEDGTGSTTIHVYAIKSQPTPAEVEDGVIVVTANPDPAERELISYNGTWMTFSMLTGALGGAFTNFLYQEGAAGGGAVTDEDSDDTAEQMKDEILGTLPPGTVGPQINDPTKPNWTNAEFVKFIGPNGQVGETKIILGSGANLGAVPTGVNGFIHNHAIYVYDQATGTYRQTTGNEQAINRYPSSADWQSLQNIATVNGGNPSLYLIGPDAVLREFNLSDRMYMEGLSNQQMIDGVGLAGRDNLGGI